MRDRQQIRAEVMATIVEDMRKDRDCGADPIKEAVKRGIPEMVATEAWVDLECKDVDAWWDQVERTIDGELIRNAIANPSA